MAHQLLATFYVQEQGTPSRAISVSAEVQMQSGTNWSTDSGTYSGNFYVEVSHAPTGSHPYRSKIDVFRRSTNMTPGGEERFVLYKAGTYERKLVVKFEGVIVLERRIYLTIQPEMHVWREADGTRVDMVTTSRAVVESNPAHHTVTVNVAANINPVDVDESNGYKDTIFITSNLPVDTYCEDISLETEPSTYSVNTWLRLAETIRMTRKIGGSSTMWSTGTPPMGTSPIQTDAHGTYTSFLTDSHLANSYYTAAELGLEKPLLDLPLVVQADWELYGRSVNRYTGSGTATEGTNPIQVPLSTILTTAHRISITPDVLTLDEDNNYTSFAAIEANEGVNWTLTTNNTKLTVSPTSGTGRGAVTIRKAPSYTLPGHFESITLTATSTVNGISVSDTADVHLEHYTPAQNALIPKTTHSIAFDQTLTGWAEVGTWNFGTTSPTLDDLDQCPFIEYEFNDPHRIRSWSLQSVGQESTGRLAAKFVLQGRTLDGEWNILDIAPLNQFYLADKPRVDRKVHHREIVDKIRIAALSITGYGINTMIKFPKIQVFAGEPVLPTMTSATADGVRIHSSGTNAHLIFDKKVAGANIASVGSANWYFNSRGTPNNDVANNGEVQRFTSSQTTSLNYLVVSFPASHLIGYLYSIDDLSGDGTHANVPYAASLYFEGRDVNDASKDTADSVGNWNDIGLISLDQCIGNTSSTSPTGAQLDMWTQNVLGLTGSDKNKAFIIAGGSILQWNGSTWENKGATMTVAMDAISEQDNQTHYADLLKEGEPMLLAQLRFIVKSIMNIAKLPNAAYHTAMPEMQFFGLPAAPINTGTIATTLYLKAEDTAGNVHDILGRHQRLPYQSYYVQSSYSYSTRFRFYVDLPHHVLSTDTKLYLTVENSQGTKTTGSVEMTSNAYSTSADYRDISVAGDYRELAYYELSIYDANKDKIVLSSGYTGGHV